MRMCLKVQIPVEAGNKAIMNGNMQKSLESFLGQLKPEAAYFLPQDGVRSMMIFFDMKENSQMPVISETVFEELQAKIDITPAMNLDDLMAGLQQVQNNR